MLNAFSSLIWGRSNNQSCADNDPAAVPEQQKFLTNCVAKNNGVISACSRGHEVSAFKDIHDQERREDEEVEVYNAYKGTRLIKSEKVATENRNGANIIKGEIYKREERIVYIKPNGIKVNLNVVSSVFIPKVGDLVELEIKAQEGEIDFDDLVILKINPSQIKAVNGMIHSFDEKTFSGCIGDDIYFDRESLTEGYLPRTLDRVVAEVIESNQDNCKWRALKVILQKSFQQHVNLSSLDDTKFTSYESNIHGIQITDNITVHSSKFNENCAFYITVTNELPNNILLREITFVSKISQIKLIYPKVHQRLYIHSDSLVKFEFVLNAKTVGTSTEIIVFVFDEFSIGRTITIKMSTGAVVNHVVTYKNHINDITRMRNFHRNELEVNNKETTNNLSPNNRGRANRHQVPDSLWSIFLKYDNRLLHNKNICHDLQQEYPCIKDEITFQSYEDRFHSLLYLEEIESVISMRKYDQNNIRFENKGEFITLEVENLADKKPSIIIGDKIIAIHPLPTIPNASGSVQKVTARHVHLKFPTEINTDVNYSVRVVQSRVSLKKLHNAAHCAVKNLGKHFLFPTEVVKKDPQIKFTYDEYVDTNNSNKKSKPVTKLYSNKEILNAIRNKMAANKTSPTSSILKLEWYDKNLNYHQKEAVRNVLLGEARPLPYIIFGPPGTGKTITIVEIILQIVKMVPYSRILVGAPSNNAADLIAVRLVDTGCFGQGELIRFVSYKSLVDDSIPTKLAPYGALGSPNKDDTSEDPMAVARNLGSSLYLGGNHRVVIGTCSALGTLHNMGFSKGHFSHIIVDEAGQSTEPETMIPLVLLNVKRGQVILSGDPMQLGPVINSRHATEFGLGESFIERLLNRFPYVRDVEGFPRSGGYDPRLVTCLVYNYRSLPGIIALSNKLFYHSELRPTLSETDSPEAKFLNRLKDLLPKSKTGTPSVVFHGLDGKNFQTEDSPSWYNPDEACQVFYYVDELYKLGVAAKDIGIISPYSKQVRHIRLLLKEAGFDVPKIGTVEEFQGHEFNVIILSTVRSNAKFFKKFVATSLGFISNPKRLNVALTRAHCLTIVVGNPSLLKHDPYWRTLLIDCIVNKTYVGCELKMI